MDGSSQSPPAAEKSSIVAAAAVAAGDLGRDRGDRDSSTPVAANWRELTDDATQTSDAATRNGPS